MIFFALLDFFCYLIQLVVMNWYNHSQFGMAYGQLDWRWDNVTFSQVWLGLKLKSLETQTFFGPCDGCLCGYLTALD